MDDLFTAIFERKARGRRKKIRVRPAPTHSLAVKLLADISSTSTAPSSTISTTPGPSSTISTAPSSTISTTPTPPNPQLSSPLFSLLPPEIRNHIFSLSLHEHSLPSLPVPFHSFAYRPSHAHAKGYSGFGLIRSCKRVYLETWGLAVSGVEFRDWVCWDDRIPRVICTSPITGESVGVGEGEGEWIGEGTVVVHEGSLRGSKRFEKMTIEQRDFVRTIHIFAQQYELEKPSWSMQVLGRHANKLNPSSSSSFSPSASSSDSQSNLDVDAVRPRKVIITVRFNDWWGWSGDTTLQMGEPEYGAQWREGFRAFGDRLEEVQIEMETVEQRKGELEEIVRGMREWKIPVGCVEEGKEGKVLVMGEDGEVRREVWEGSRFCVDEEEPEEGTALQKYVVYTVRWKAVT